MILDGVYNDIEEQVRVSIVCIVKAKLPEVEPIHFVTVNFVRPFISCARRLERSCNILAIM